jgi:hypothetical protein
VLIDQDKCRGWRMCVSGCPYKKIYYNWKSGKAEKCIFCYPRIEAGQPTVCSETCVGRIRYLGVLLYDADRIQEAASVERDRDLYQAQLDIFLDPNDPKVIAQARIDGIPDNWMEAARNSPVYKMAVQWKVALPLHPEYRTLPMVWYVPPLSPITAGGQRRPCRQPMATSRTSTSCASRCKYLANLLTAGDTGAGGASAGTHAGDARLPARQARRASASTWPCCSRWACPGRGRGDVPRDGDCQLRRPLRDSYHPPRVRREHLRRAWRLRLQLRQRLLRWHQRDQPFGSEKKRTDPDQGGGLSMLRLSTTALRGAPLRLRRHRCACWPRCWPIPMPELRALPAERDERALLHDEPALGAARLPSSTRWCSTCAAPIPCRPSRYVGQLSTAAGRPRCTCSSMCMATRATAGPAMIDLAQTYEKAGLFSAEASCPTTCRWCWSSPRPSRRARPRRSWARWPTSSMPSSARCAARNSPYASVLGACSSSGERAQAVALPAEPAGRGLGRARSVFDGCSTQGQARPASRNPCILCARPRRSPKESPHHDRLA